MISLNTAKDETVDEAAERLYELHPEAGVEVLYDDRVERFGVAFHHADHIGIPIRVVACAKRFADGKVKVSLRHDKELMP